MGRGVAPPPPEDAEIAVRAYAPREGAKPKKGRKRSRVLDPGPSSRVLLFDTETTTGAVQQLRFGSYLWVDEDGAEEGLFYDPASVTEDELACLQVYAGRRGLRLITDRDFCEAVFYARAYLQDATIVGFNLPFDISRLAVHHRPLLDAFSFQLCAEGHDEHPNITITHLSSSAALSGFSKRRGDRTPESLRRQGLHIQARRGYFVDCKTAAAALLGFKGDLRSLAELLETPTRKLRADYHGPINVRYIRYARRDVKVTYECFTALRERYQGYRLSTDLSGIYSEASVGKACLKDMGIVTWRQLQPNFDPKLIGAVMSSYYGGRSEVRVRRQITRVLYADFLSMYPTVCSLLGLFNYVRSKGIRTRDVTAATRAFLETVTPDELQDKENWKRLAILVKVKPSGDLFPVRMKYSKGSSYTIGLNHLTTETLMWFTLADAVVSKILTGRPPSILEALAFEPLGQQENMAPIELMGRSEYRIDPAADDFYARLIELRMSVQDEEGKARERGDIALADRLDAGQLALKVTANATSYGIFVEENVHPHGRLQELSCYGAEEEPFIAWNRNVEEPGNFFHPLLATLITGGARLMLALAEHRAEQEGIGWAFCDTDSMALACPEGMAEEVFLAAAGRVRGWFQPLNPYSVQAEIFKSEDVNLELVRGRPSRNQAPLYCLAIAPKRYVLFNRRANRIVIRKASAHGLGHLLPPYTEGEAPPPAPVVSLKDLEVRRFEHDLWVRIIRAVYSSHPERVDYRELPNLTRPAVSRYSATTPTLLSWFRFGNRNKPYREKVRPFGFLYNFQGRKETGSMLEPPRAVAAYDDDLDRAAAQAFDRTTGAPVDTSSLKTYQEGLLRYHLHPEDKFSNADYLDSGETTRRHLRAVGVVYIGKEANRWEEQLYTGEDLEAQVVYGMSPRDEARLRDEVLRSCEPYGVREIARAAGRSADTVSRFIRGIGKTDAETIRAIRDAIVELEDKRHEAAKRVLELLGRLRRWVSEVGLGSVSDELGVDASNLGKVLRGERMPNIKLLSRIEEAMKSGAR